MERSQRTTKRKKTQTDSQACLPKETNIPIEKDQTQ